MGLPPLIQALAAGVAKPEPEGLVQEGPQEVEPEHDPEHGQDAAGGEAADDRPIGDGRSRGDRLLSDVAHGALLSSDLGCLPIPSSNARSARCRQGRRSALSRDRRSRGRRRPINGSAHAYGRQSAQHAAWPRARQPAYAARDPAWPADSTRSSSPSSRPGRAARRSAGWSAPRRSARGSRAPARSAEASSDGASSACRSRSSTRVVTAGSSSDWPAATRRTASTRSVLRICFST